MVAVNLLPDLRGTIWAWPDGIWRGMVITPRKSRQATRERASELITAAGGNPKAADSYTPHVCEAA